MQKSGNLGLAYGFRRQRRASDLSSAAVVGSLEGRLGDTVRGKPQPPRTQSISLHTFAGACPPLTRGPARHTGLSWSIDVIGGCTRIRTLDPLIKSPMLRNKISHLGVKLGIWWGLRDNGLGVKCKTVSPLPAPAAGALGLIKTDHETQVFSRWHING